MVCVCACVQERWFILCDVWETETDTTACVWTQYLQSYLCLMLHWYLSDHVWYWPCKYVWLCMYGARLLPASWFPLLPLPPFSSPPLHTPPPSHPSSSPPSPPPKLNCQLPPAPLDLPLSVAVLMLCCGLACGVNLVECDISLSCRINDSFLGNATDTRTGFIGEGGRERWGGKGWGEEGRGRTLTFIAFIL